MKLSFTLFLLVVPELARCGCCNDNYWCDGDPSFREQPTVSQKPNETEVVITWSEAYLNLAKCVDYFFVKYAESDVNHTMNNAFTMIPVSVVRKKTEDEWEEAMNPLFSQYKSSFEAEHDKDYVIKVVAVDKGAGWGELEGRAIVEAKPIFYHSRPVMKAPRPPDPLVEIQESLKKKYPPSECNAHKLCEALATEWAQDVTKHVARFALPYLDPKTLPPIDIEDEDETIKRYADGKLHHLKKFQTNVTDVEKVADDMLKVNISLKFRLLRTSYVWQNFFSDGILSLYHTCGTRLPVTIFDDVDLEDVEEIVAEECAFFVVVQILVPIFPSEKRANVSKIFFSIRRDDFDFDATWFTSHFHDLDQIWMKQKVIMEKVLRTVMRDSFSSAIMFNRPTIWLKKKFRQIDNQIIAAKNKKNRLSE